MIQPNQAKSIFFIFFFFFSFHFIFFFFSAPHLIEFAGNGRMSNEIHSPSLLRLILLISEFCSFSFFVVITYIVVILFFIARVYMFGESEFEFEMWRSEKHHLLFTFKRRPIAVAGVSLLLRRRPTKITFYLICAQNMRRNKFSFFAVWPCVRRLGLVKEIANAVVMLIIMIIVIIERFEKIGCDAVGTCIEKMLCTFNIILVFWPNVGCQTAVDTTHPKSILQHQCQRLPFCLDALLFFFHFHCTFPSLFGICIRWCSATS